VHITWDSDNTLKLEMPAGKDATVRVRQGQQGYAARQFDGPVAVAADHSILYIENQRAGSRHSPRK